MRAAYPRLHRENPAHPAAWRPDPGEVLYDATLRNLQTLSEATQRLPDDLKLPYPAIPRQRISGFRNILVHNCPGDIDAETVQAIVQQHLLPLEAAIRHMLAG